MQNQEKHCDSYQNHIANYHLNPNISNDLTYWFKLFILEFHTWLSGKDSEYTVTACVPIFMKVHMSAIQWWFVNPGSDSPEISLIRTKSAGTNFRFWSDGRFSNLENSLIRKYRPGTNVSRSTNHHCTCYIFCVFCCTHHSCTNSNKQVYMHTHTCICKYNMHSSLLICWQFHPYTKRWFQSEIMHNKCLYLFSWFTLTKDKSGISSYHLVKIKEFLLESYCFYLIPRLSPISGGFLHNYFSSEAKTIE